MEAYNGKLSNNLPKIKKNAGTISLFVIGLLYRIFRSVVV